LLLLNTSAIGLLLAASAPAGLETIQHPDLSGARPEVSAVLEPAVSYFESQEDVLTGEALADLYGFIGMHYQAQRLNGAAATAYRNAIALAPSDFRWHYYLAYLFEESARVEDAIAAYERALEIQPDYTPARMRLAQIWLATGSVDRAAETYRGILAESLADAPALVGMGQILASRGHHEEAIELYQRAIAAQPGANFVYALLAQSYSELGIEDSAAIYRDRAGNRPPYIADPALALMTARANGSPWFVGRGVEALQAGQLEVALNTLSMALAINPLDLDARAMLARALRRADNVEAAEIELTRVLESDPEHQIALMNLADLRLEQERMDEAIPLLRTATQQGGDPVSYALLADALLLDGQFDEAAYIYNQLGGLERAEGTTNPDPYFYAGIATSAAGRCDDSLTFFTIAFSRNPPLPARLEALVRVTATCPSSTPEQRAEILNMAEALYLNFPSQEASETFAMALAANGRFDEATDLQGQAIFEALRDGRVGFGEYLRENMQRYGAGQIAMSAWPEGHPIFRSSRLGGAARCRHAPPLLS
jgi:tetratricopeptide (TPR) repeat protein